ncbi:hypothetical protein [uncultured Thermomonospora sp.]|uniref:hypothetical protein n=1 Tax=uncultured Thermomonospora sp. TaxID=671175 RepID=UPI00259BCA9E|nr:hypothetical protein [uncultured Thermomonospora sp.]
MTTTPEIAAKWRQLRNGIARTLRPYVQEAKVYDLADEIVAEHIAGPGWRPPLEVAPDVIAEARTARTRRALASTAEGEP